MDNATNDFAAGGTPRESGEMWPGKTSEPGDALLGRLEGIKRVGQGAESYEVAMFAPIAIRRNTGKVEGFAALSVAISATLKTRLTARDIGETFALIYTGVEPGKKYKNFKVYEQTGEKLAQVLTDAGAPADLIADIRKEKLPF
jgi:hypothetical protein